MPQINCERVCKVSDATLQSLQLDDIQKLPDSGRRREGVNEKPEKSLSLSLLSLSLFSLSKFNLSLSKFTLSLSRNSFYLSLEFTLQSVMDRLCERDMWYDEMKNAKRIMEQLEEVLMMEGVPEICPWGGRIVDIISENDPSRGHSLSS